ncbi:MAG: putative addiction module antidote protein [Burkholderiaceae bacterium]|nr:putative addiction module antidote protein [Burkholderiaceae bacterium]
MTARRASRFDDYLAETLKDPAEAAAYIEATLEPEDMDALLVALRHVARAHGMADVARRAEFGEKTLFRALGKDGNPTLATMQKVLHAMGLRLSVAPLRELDAA